MTKFSKLLASMTKERIRLANNFLLMNALFILVEFIFNYFTEKSYKVMSKSLFFSYVFIVGFSVVILIMFAAISIRELSQNKYRLLPIKDSKFYISSVISNFLSITYLAVIDFSVVWMGTYLIYISDHFTRKSTNYWLSASSGDTISTLFLTLLFLTVFLILTALLGIILLNTVSELVSIVTDAIPGGKQKFIKIVIYILGIYLVFKLGTMIDLSRNIVEPGEAIISLSSTVDIIQTFVEIFIFTGVNSYLLRFVETRK